MDQLPKPIELRDMAKRLLHNHIHTAIPTLTYSPHASYMFQFLYEHKETKNEYRWMTKISAAEFKVKIARRRDGSENVQGLSNENIQNAANKLGFKEFSE